MTKPTPTVELLPCPFCGSAGAIHENGIGDYYVRCNLCEASTDQARCEEPEHAAKRWNTRAHLAQQSAQSTAAVPNLDEYYLQDSRTYVGNSMLWWGKGRAGYYCDLKDAHVFTKDEAYEQHRSRSSDIPWPKFYIDALASRHADVQRVKREQADAAIERAKAGKVEG